MRLVTTEQVSRWHPDKVADQVSDSLCNAILRIDPVAHVGIETLIKNDHVVVAGEVKCNLGYGHTVDDLIACEVKKTMDSLGYRFDIEDENPVMLVYSQSEEINKAVIGGRKRSAGDQGIVFGYCDNRTETKLPYGFEVANKVIHYFERIKEASDESGYKLFYGDAKVLVTEDVSELSWNINDRIKRIYMSVCTVNDDRTAERVLKQTLCDKLGIDQSKVSINPNGPWTNGGSYADCGLTGRKIVCDSYGGYAPVGGGSYSGKDWTKVDRTAAYMARAIAKDVCRLYIFDTTTVQLGYMIGCSEPVSVCVEADGKSYSFVDEYVRKNYDLTPDGMREFLHLDTVDLSILSRGCHYRPRDWGGLG